MDVNELADELWNLVRDHHGARYWEGFLEQRLAAKAPSPEAGEMCDSWLKASNEAWELRWKIWHLANELCLTLGDSAPRSLHEFAVHMQPHGDEAKALELWPTVQVDLRTMPDCARFRTERSPGTPAKILRGWPQIRAALDIKESRQQSLSYWAKSVPNCPIKFGAKGQRPEVVEADLLRWWDEQVLPSVQESDDRRRDKEETTSETYRHGRSAEVVPGIVGHVKHPRRSEKVD